MASLYNAATHSSEKYKIVDVKVSQYRMKMILTINNLDQHDAGNYVCVSGECTTKKHSKTFYSISCFLSEFSALTKNNRDKLKICYFFPFSKQATRWEVRTIQLGLVVNEWRLYFFSFLPNFLRTTPKSHSQPPKELKSFNSTFIFGFFFLLAGSLSLFSSRLIVESSRHTLAALATTTSSHSQQQRRPFWKWSHVFNKLQTNSFIITIIFHTFRFVDLSSWFFYSTRLLFVCIPWIFENEKRNAVVRCYRANWFWPCFFLVIE